MFYTDCLFYCSSLDTLCSPYCSTQNKILKFSFLPHLAINFIPPEIIRKPWFFESPVTCECLKIIYTTKNFLTGYKIVSSCQLISMENLSLISQVNLRLLSNSSFCFLETS